MTVYIIVYSKFINKNKNIKKNKTKKTKIFFFIFINLFILTHKKNE